MILFLFIYLFFLPKSTALIYQKYCTMRPPRLESCSPASSKLHYKQRSRAGVRSLCCCFRRRRSSFSGVSSWWWPVVSFFSVINPGSKIIR